MNADGLIQYSTSLFTITLYKALRVSTKKLAHKPLSYSSSGAQWQFQTTLKWFISITIISL